MPKILPGRNVIEINQDTMNQAMSEWLNKYFGGSVNEVFVTKVSILGAQTREPKYKIIFTDTRPRK